MKQTLAYYATLFYRSFSAYSTEELQKLGLNYGSLFFVIYTGKHPGCTQAELTSDLHMDWGHSQRSIEKLIADGFMTREKEGRSYHLTLTELGLKAFETAHDVFFDWDSKKLTVLSRDEQKTLLSLLDKVAKGNSFGDANV